MARVYHGKARPRDFAFPLALCGAIATGLGIGSVVPPSVAQAAMPRQTAEDPGIVRDFGSCHSGGGTNCVVDGDTFWLDGEKVRIADIDAPETHPSRCAREAGLGAQATARLQVLLNAGPVVLDVADRDIDRYGRKLRIVRRDGRSLGTMLVDEGLARPWEGRRRPWCDA